MAACISLEHEFSTIFRFYCLIDPKNMYFSEKNFIKPLDLELTSRIRLNISFDIKEAIPR